MKPSRYNHIIRRRNQPQLLYNSRLHRFLELDSTRAALYGGLSLPLTYNLINQKDPPVAELMAELAGTGFMIEDTVDELAQIEVLSHLYRFDRSRLNLWICPTTRCDQECPGCPYQNDRTDLPDQGWERILRTIADRGPGLKHLSITWWGGQPAMAWKKVLEFDKKISHMSRQSGFEYSYCTIGSGGGPANRLTALSRENELYLNIGSVDLNNLPEAKIVILGSLKEISRQVSKIPKASRVRFLDNKPGEKLCRNLNQLCQSAPNLEDEDVEALNLMVASGFTSENLPRPKPVACQAVDPQSFIMDVSGAFYKCWEDVGRPGKALPENIDDPTDMRIFRWLDWDPYHEAHCRLCNILPWCLGGCRAKPPDVDCSQWHYVLREMLSLSAATNKNGA